jgi:heptaprenyl diphosphate synthase
VTTTLTTNREDHLIAWLAALAITIHLIEAALPSPIPGIKPGLANVVTVAALMLFGWRVAAWVSLLRVLIGSLFAGTFLSPTFALSLSGALGALLVLGLASSIPGVRFGPVGYCLLAAMTHMAAQIVVAYALFIHHPGLFSLMPVLMTAAVVFGAISGIVTQTALDSLKEQRP